ncbi:ribosome maturation factor RimP [Hydrogenibacillus schlegelii]|nr:ribosome maturation factor RimP [Hydrogenibacillus schlegelii]
MDRRAVEAKVESLALPLLQRMGLELVHLEFVKEHGVRYLRIFVDKPGGIGVDELARVNEALSRRLDDEDPISESYILEVSSPGAERVLKTDREFAWAEGKFVRIETREPVDGATVFEGTLRSGADPLVVEVDGRPVAIPRAQVKLARRAMIG